MENHSKKPYQVSFYSVQAGSRAARFRAGGSHGKGLRNLPLSGSSHTRNPKTPISRLLDLFPSSPIPCYISCTLHRNREASMISLREYIGNFRVFYCKCQNSIPRFHCLVKLRAYCILLPCGSLALPASETDPTGMPPMAAAARRTAGSLMENVSCTADLHGC